MAYFAKLDNNNIVLEVLAVNNAELNDLPFPESEPLGVDFLTQWSGGYTNWKQTSFNRNFRKHYAGIGDTYDAIKDAFIMPSPYPSWTFNETDWVWESPVPHPNDGKRYIWFEPGQQWIEVLQ